MGLVSHLAIPPETHLVANPDSVDVCNVQAGQRHKMHGH